LCLTNTLVWIGNLGSLFKTMGRSTAPYITCKWFNTKQIYELYIFFNRYYCFCFKVVFIFCLISWFHWLIFVTNKEVIAPRVHRGEVFLRPMSCVSDVVYVSGLSILGCLCGVLLRLWTTSSWKLCQPLTNISILIAGFLNRVSRLVPLAEKKLFTLSELRIPLRWLVGVILFNVSFSV
jgi:hypothetical protein